MTMVVQRQQRQQQDLHQQQALRQVDQQQRQRQPARVVAPATLPIFLLFSSGISTNGIS
jgi:hypothetical protein